jgi:hypothetical protein
MQNVENGLTPSEVPPMWQTAPLDAYPAARSIILRVWPEDPLRWQPVQTVSVWGCRLLAPECNRRFPPKEKLSIGAMIRKGSEAGRELGRRPGGRSGGKSCPRPSLRQSVLLCSYGGALSRQDQTSERRSQGGLLSSRFEGGLGASRGSACLRLSYAGRFRRLS